MSFERARAIADAVLLEGYVLYPYRASAPKNRFRWTFGVLAPRAWSEAGGCEPWWMEAQCLVEPQAAARVDVRLRFLHARQRRVEQAMEGQPDAFRPVEVLHAGDRQVLPWDEGDVREIDLDDALAGADAAERVVAFEVPGGGGCEPVRDPAGAVVGRVLHDQRAVRGRVRISAERVAAACPLVRLRLRVENETPWQDLAARRDEALRGSCIAAHLLMRVRDGAFVSLLDPPEWARAAAAACRNVRTYPVLAGEPGRRDLVLSAPIILYDHPQVAPESPGDFFDATEIDELLALRTAALTEGEKREARATDPRARALVERVDGLPPEILRRLHGALRSLDRGEMVPRADPLQSSPSPQQEEAPAPGIGPGQRVRLRAPGRRRTDAQDLLYVGRTATVERVEHDIDGEPLLAVTIDGDPAAEFHRWYGRYHYYRPDEVDLIEPEGAP